MKLLELARAQLRLLSERGMRPGRDAFETTPPDYARQRPPVLLAVEVLGAREYGTIDPVDDLVDTRDRLASRGL